MILVPGIVLLFLVSQFTNQDLVAFQLHPPDLPRRFICEIGNGNSPIRSIIVRVIIKSDNSAAGVRFVYHEYGYRPNWTTRSPITS